MHVNLNLDNAYFWCHTRQMQRYQNIHNAINRVERLTGYGKLCGERLCWTDTAQTNTSIYTSVTRRHLAN